jgi:limonene 1,2-monooxygenase
MVANRLILLDHLTHGRVMFGFGPGLLVSDAHMLGIDPNTQRDRMLQSLDVILRLFRGETVTETTDWYRLVEATAHLLPYSKPYPEVTVASSVTPSGGRVAGKYNLSMLCVAASSTEGFDALGTNWKIACEVAAEHGHTMDPAGLRVAAPMHIADTREQAWKDVQFGFQKFIDYVNNNQQRYNIPPGQDPVQWWIEKKQGVVGTPDDAIAMIERLQQQQGEFGCMLITTSDVADWDATKRSYELYARYVMPHFSGASKNRAASYRWIGENRSTFSEKRTTAAQLMFDKHNAERKR